MDIYSFDEKKTIFPPFPRTAHLAIQFKYLTVAKGLPAVATIHNGKLCEGEQINKQLCAEHNIICHGNSQKMVVEKLKRNT